ncbi:hypothetical protein MA16_Dca025327 [Dendrobium catenatum]|uniref:Uncharacterized protein n=1 Tax=Dendrobium catenatum TaxID=906689 RepID=A0A2I0VGR7_9ASPA|nr:hypothetical protein MA16_Dca025327 [Dendrobium catenatum]
MVEDELRSGEVSWRRNAGGEREGATAAAVNQRMVRQRSGVSISEATICMLMDRFAPS